MHGYVISFECIMMLWCVGVLCGISSQVYYLGILFKFVVSV